MLACAGVVSVVQDRKVQLTNEKVIGNGSFGVVFQVCVRLCMCAARDDGIKRKGREARKDVFTKR